MSRQKGLAFMFCSICCLISVFGRSCLALWSPPSRRVHDFWTEALNLLRCLCVWGGGGRGCRGMGVSIWPFYQYFFKNPHETEIIWTLGGRLNPRTPSKSATVVGEERAGWFTICWFVMWVMFVVVFFFIYLFPLGVIDRLFFSLIIALSGLWLFPFITNTCPFKRFENFTTEKGKFSDKKILIFLLKT